MVDAGGASARAASWVKWALAALIVLRLVYISHDEIRVLPHDATAYIMQARAWYWGNSYSNWAYTRQPGYPLFIAASSMLGVPLRLAIEGVWIASVLVVVRACVKIGLRPRGGVLLAALLLFHPFGTELFNWVFADTLYTCAWLVYTVSLGMSAGGREPRSMLRWGVLAAGAGAVAANTRQETVLVYALAMVTGGLVLASAWWGRGAARGFVRRCVRDRLIAAVLLPSVSVFASVQGFHAANYTRIGAHVGYDWSLPGFKALYQTMLSIPPEEPRLRVPIPRDVRERAAAVSPMFAAMREEMERGEICAGFRRAGARTTGIEDEPGSFNLWTMRESIWVVWGDTIKLAADYDAICWRVVAELQAAQDRGELGRRWALMSFIPPEWDQLPMACARSLGTCWSILAHVKHSRWEERAVEPRIARAFDEMGLRRSSLVQMNNPDPPPKGVWQHRGTVKNLDAIKDGIERGWSVLVWIAASAWLGGWLMAWNRRRRGVPGAGESWWMLASVCGASLIMRTALVCVLDATGVEASHRYLFPSAVLLVVAGMLGSRGMFAGVARSSQAS